jgi:hypothetical protein
MNPISLNSKRLAAVTDVPGMLDASYDAFEDIIAIARRHQEDDQTAFPAFVLVAGAAANGRDWIAEAPSLPPTSPGRHVRDFSDEADLAQEVSLIAAIASELATRLAVAAQRATKPEDRVCCENAAAEADAICALIGAASPP